MSGPVDVLAVMRRDATNALSWVRTCNMDADVHFASSAEARAAVAELIEADLAYDEALATHGIASRWTAEANDRRRAALAKVQP